MVPPLDICTAHFEVNFSPIATTRRPGLCHFMAYRHPVYEHKVSDVGIGAWHWTDSLYLQQNQCLIGKDINKAILKHKTG